MTAISDRDARQLEIERDAKFELDLSSAHLAGAWLRHTNLSDAGLDHANLSGATLWHANLSDATLQRTDLSGAMFNYADLSGAILDGADLSGAGALWCEPVWRTALRHKSIFGEVFFPNDRPDPGPT